MKLYELQGIEKIHKNENPTNKQRDGTSDQDNYAGMTEKMVFKNRHCCRIELTQFINPFNAGKFHKGIDNLTLMEICHTTLKFYEKL